MTQSKFTFKKGNQAMKANKVNGLMAVALTLQVVFAVSCSEKDSKKQTDQAVAENSVSEFSAMKDTVQAPNFLVSAVEDASFISDGRRVVRIVYRVKVDRSITDDEIRAVCNKILPTAKPYNAIAFFFYLPDSDIKGTYTAGKAEWAPLGQWSSAKNVETGDYSQHQLVVKSGNPLGAVPASEIVDISIETKKKMFYELVALQDKGMDAENSQKTIAKKYKITREQLDKIRLEGNVNGWPLPPVK